MNTVKYGGGSWHCEKCGKTIQGSSIHHNCVPIIKIENKPEGCSAWTAKGSAVVQCNCMPCCGFFANGKGTQYAGEGMDMETFGKPEDTTPVMPRSSYPTKFSEQNTTDCPSQLLNMQAGNLITVTMVDIAKGHYNCIGEMCRRPILDHPYKDEKGWYVKINVSIDGKDTTLPVYWNTTMNRFEITLK